MGTHKYLNWFTVAIVFMVTSVAFEYVSCRKAIHFEQSKVMQENPGTTSSTESKGVGKTAGTKDCCVEQL